MTLRNVAGILLTVIGFASAVQPAFQRYRGKVPDKVARDIVAGVVLIIIGLWLAEGGSIAQLVEWLATFRGVIDDG